MTGSFMIVKSESGEAMINLAEISYATAASPNETMVNFTDGKRLLVHAPLSTLTSRTGATRE